MRFVGPALLAAALALWATVAHATTVYCHVPHAVCQVSNDDADRIACLCADGRADEDTGGDEFTDLTLEELGEVCVAELSMCDEARRFDGPDGLRAPGEPTGDDAVDRDADEVPVVQFAAPSDADVVIDADEHDGGCRIGDGTGGGWAAGLFGLWMLARRKRR